MKQENPIHNPYEAPEGYFEGFNARVIQKIGRSGQMKRSWQLRINRKFLYVAAAAVILVFVTSGIYRVLDLNSKLGINIAKDTKTEKVSDTATATAVAVKPESAEDAVIQYSEEEASIQQAVAVQESPKNSEALSIEEELEAEGLIVRDIETEWFDNNEILP
ncbi:MAG: hypothetical protein RLZZ161_453 [Bacteroidota bacterium]|jgi:hypothetical protein